MIRNVHYFEDLKADNTQTVLTLIRKRALESNIKKILLASTTGVVASRALEYFKDDEIELIVVPHQFDFMTDDSNRFPAQKVEEIRNSGHKVHFGTMLFHTEKLYANGAASVAANFLRTFGEGSKVCVEITLMCADAGLVSQKERIIVAAGTGRGLDTALLIHPASSQNLSALKISEIICKPLLSKEAVSAVSAPLPDEGQTALETIFNRRSVRDFEKRDIDEAHKALLFRAAAAAPSAHGKMPWKFTQMNDKSVTEKIIAKFPWFAPAAKSALNILVLGEPDKCVNREYWVVDCAAATQNILLAAHSLGLGAVWMGIAPVESNISTFNEVMKTPEGLVPFSLIAIGYPKETERPKGRITDASPFII